MHLKKLLCGLALLLIAGISYSQSSSIKGTLTDTVERKSLSNAVVAILRKSDSVLIKFTRSDKDGHFTISNLPNTKIILQVTHPSYADYVDTMQVNGPMQLNNLAMTPKSRILEEVIVKQNVAIRLKGDTIEYKADSFKVEQGASVKELLRKLPGLQVDKNGQVTAQGQKVEKVLVDGEEFFSDDPAVVIENLRADAIDKVQSYDKKSDQAEFTGVDDGSRSKTLNLVLKDDKKKGLLGKIVVGGGSEERYSTQAMLNYFKGKKKLSVYGIANNLGVTGLDWSDRGKFGAGDDFGDADVEMGAGFIMINSGGDDDFSDWGMNYYDEGIPKTIKAGAHYNNKWNSDKQSINSNYTIKNLQNVAIGNSLTKYLLPDSAYYYKENHRSNTRNTEQMLTNTYDVKFDSTSSLKIKVNGKLTHSENISSNNEEVNDENLSPVNRNFRSINTTSDGRIGLVSALWRKKLQKKGRTISWSASHKYNETASDGFLLATTTFFKANVPVAFDTTDQKKLYLGQTHTTQSKIVYTEPLGKKAILEFNYAFNRTASISDRKSFDKLNGKYDQLNDEFSLKYSLQYYSNSAGAKYQYNGKKLSANVGANIGYASYVQRNALGKQVNKLNYTNIFPTSRITYKFAPQRSLNLTYSGSPQSPSVDQVQPIRQNENNLFIEEGNPNLQQSFQHSISLFFTDFKILSGRNIWINGSFSPMQNAIVSSQRIDSGITYSKYVNTNGNYNYWFYTSYGFKIPKTEINVSFNFNPNGSRYVNFVQGKQNITNNTTMSIGYWIGQYKENKFDYSINSNFSYNHSKSSLGSLTNNYWGQEHNIRGRVSFSKRFSAGTEMNMWLRQKTKDFPTNNNITVWGADLSYKFFKNKNGVLKFEMNDILNQRRGYERSFTNNYIKERNYNQLGRYGLLSFTWNFTKNGATK